MKKAKAPPGAVESRYILSTLLVILIVMKHLKIVHCSWWWVFSPLWIPMAIAAVFLGWYLWEMRRLKMRQPSEEEALRKLWLENLRQMRREETAKKREIK